MGEVVQVKIEGGEELIKTLRRLGFEMEPIMEEAGHDGAQVIVDAANRRAPEPLVKAETEKVRKASVSVKIGFPKEKWYWRFLETGAQPHTITGAPLLAFPGEQGWVVTGGVSHPGMAARPFLRPAVDGQEDAVADEVGKTLKRPIDRACRG